MFRRLLGIFCAILLHAGFLLFGGMVLVTARPNQGQVQQVDLLSTDDEKKKDDKKPDEPKPDEVKPTDEKPPDANEVIHNVELSAAAAAPALDAASLSSIEAALSGQVGGGGDFAEGMSFASGGRIGGTGKAGADQAVDNAFSMSEIDQKPRAVFQAAPVYPTKMHSVEGLVTVIFVVDETGKVTDPKVEKSSNPEFEKPALDAIKQWKFEPALKAGQRVSSKMRVPIRFQPK